MKLPFAACVGGAWTSGHEHALVGQGSECVRGRGVAASASMPRAREGHGPVTVSVRYRRKAARATSVCAGQGAAASMSMPRVRAGREPAALSVAGRR
jgi:hypothetical protein